MVWAALALPAAAQVSQSSAEGLIHTNFGLRQLVLQQRFQIPDGPQAAGDNACLAAPPARAALPLARLLFLFRLGLFRVPSPFGVVTTRHLDHIVRQLRHIRRLGRLSNPTHKSCQHVRLARVRNAAHQLQSPSHREL